MKRFAVLATILVLGGAWYVVKDVGHIPLFSSNLERLAENETEAWCAGVGFWLSSGNQVEAAAIAADCRATRPATPMNLQLVQRTFCNALEANGYVPGSGQCLMVVQSNRYWPTYDGGVTNAWSRNYPYPGDLILQTPTVDSDSRTGDREGNFR